MRSCLNDLTTRAFQLGGLLLQSSEVRASWKFFEPTIGMKFQAWRKGKISTRRMPETGAYGGTIRTRCLSRFRVLRVGQIHAPENSLRCGLTSSHRTRGMGLHPPQSWQD